MRAFTLVIAAIPCILTPHSSSASLNNGGQRGVVRAMSAETFGIGSIHLGAGGAYGRDDNYVMGPNGASTVTGGSLEPAQLISGTIYALAAPARHLDVSVAMPLYYDITGFGETAFGYGDVEAAIKLKFPLLTRNPIFMHSYYLGLTAPTGKKNTGYFPRRCCSPRASAGASGDMYSLDGIAVMPKMLWTLKFASLALSGKGFPLQLHLNLGTVISKQFTERLLTANFAAEYTPINFLTIFAEASSEINLDAYQRTYKPSELRKNPLWMTPGIKFNLPQRVYVLAAADFGLSSRDDDARTNWSRNGYSYSTAVLPLWGAQIAVGWSLPSIPQDADGDGITDDKDKCPQEAEDKDGFEDDDGCPDKDNDKDGVFDFADKCPDDPALCDGCPPRDKDGDGIADKKDKCPDMAEDIDGFEDEDGCPDFDNDRDEIPDAHDKCPNDKEDFDRFADEDGCPDDDNDNDGVPDQWDQCPDRFGSKDNNGCPKAKQIERGRLILKGVQFETGTATLTPNSYIILNEVLESLREWPEVKIEVRGYTDSIGSDQVNLRLSQARAESVAEYLVGKGIDRARVTPIGMGEADPIADNTTAAGRAKNRRVEIHRTD